MHRFHSHLDRQERKQLIERLLLQEAFNELDRLMESEGRSPFVFYGNICNICFDSGNLKKCSKCKTISYCSKIHQVEDWNNHKQYCAILKRCNDQFSYDEQCSFEDFTKYRKNVLSEFQKIPAPFIHKKFFQEISMFPWVCSLCYSKKNLNFQCEECKAVVYCSVEHKKDDAINHKEHCSGLKLCKIHDSIYHEKGFEVEPIEFVFEKVPRNQRFPKTMDEFSTIIQKQSKGNKNINDLISYNEHNELFAPGMTILYALDLTGILVKRVVTNKPFLSRRQREERLADRYVQQILLSMSVRMPNMKPAYTIHFVAAGKYLTSLNWSPIIAILTHWMINIDFIDAIFVGPNLAGCEEPDFEDLKVYSSYQFYPINYKSIINRLTKPDLIVLYNFDPEDEEFKDINSCKALFKYKKVPVVVTATKENYLNNFVEKLTEIENVQILVNPRLNPFKNSRPYRIWDEKCLSTYVRNQFITILRKD